MFEQLKTATPLETVNVTLDGVAITLPKGMTLAAALLVHGAYPLRTSPVQGPDGPKQRAPYCMMGVCFECLVEIDGKPNQQSCLAQVRDGMVVNRQDGAPDIKGDRT